MISNKRSQTNCFTVENFTPNIPYKLLAEQNENQANQYDCGKIKVLWKAIESEINLTITEHVAIFVVPRTLMMKKLSNLQMY